MEDFSNGFGLAASKCCPPVFSKLQNKIEYISVFAAFKIISKQEKMDSCNIFRQDCFSVSSWFSSQKKRRGLICPSLFSAAGAQKKSHGNVSHASAPTAPWFLHDAKIFWIWTDKGSFQWLFFSWKTFSLAINRTSWPEAIYSSPGNFEDSSRPDSKRPKRWKKQFTFKTWKMWIIWVVSAVQQNRSPHPPRSCSNFVSATKNQELYRKEASFLNMWILCMSLSKGSENEESFSRSKSCDCSPMAFSNFCLRSFCFEAERHTHKDIQTSQPGKTHMFLFQQGTRLFSTLGDIFTLVVTKDILWRPAKCKSSLRQLRFIT